MHAYIRKPDDREMSEAFLNTEKQARATDATRHSITAARAMDAAAPHTVTGDAVCCGCETHTSAVTRTNQSTHINTYSRFYPHFVDDQNRPSKRPAPTHAPCTDRTLDRPFNGAMGS